jgi:hypothetical protein
MRRRGKKRKKTMQLTMKMRINIEKMIEIN